MLGERPIKKGITDYEGSDRGNRKGGYLGRRDKGTSTRSRDEDKIRRKSENPQGIILLTIYLYTRI